MRAEIGSGHPSWSKVWRPHPLGGDFTSAGCNALALQRSGLPTTRVGTALSRAPWWIDFPNFGTSELAISPGGELGPNLGVRGLEVEHIGTSDLVAASGTGLNLCENLVMYGKTVRCVVTVTWTQYFPIERPGDQ